MLLVGLIVAGFWPKPMPVETAPALLGPLRVTVNEEGRTRIRQRYLVSAPITGQLRRIALDPGDPVQARQTVVAVIDPLTPMPLDARSRAAAEARRDTAIANLAKAQASLDYASSELKRSEKLRAEGALSLQDLETTQWRKTAAARELAAAESALRQAEAELAEFAAPGADANSAGRVPTTIRAPATGRVLRVMEQSSRVVNAGTPLMEVGDPADLEVVVEVLSRDGAAITPGTAVELEQWGGGNPLLARVRLVEPAAFTKVSALGVEEQRVNVIADLVAPPEQRRSLGDAFRVEARILMWQAERALKVPAGGVFRHGAEWACFVSDNGRARLRLVHVGRSSGSETQILEGVQAGERVILYPGDRIHDGQRIRAEMRSEPRP